MREAYLQGANIKKACISKGKFDRTTVSCCDLRDVDHRPSCEEDLYNLKEDLKKNVSDKKLLEHIFGGMDETTAQPDHLGRAGVARYVLCSKDSDQNFPFPLCGYAPEPDKCCLTELEIPLYAEKLALELEPAVCNDGDAVLGLANRDIFEKDLDELGAEGPIAAALAKMLLNPNCKSGEALPGNFRRKLQALATKYQ